MIYGKKNFYRKFYLAAKREFDDSLKVTNESSGLKSLKIDETSSSSN